MLAAPLNALILDSLRDGPRSLADLRGETGQPAQTTLRAQLKKLCASGAVVRRRRNGFPGALEYALSDAGHDLLQVATALDEWLKRSPEAQHVLGSNQAKAVVKALTEGWSTTMLRALAIRPLTLTKLDGVIASLSYPALERRLASLRLAGVVAAQPGEGRGTPYAMTAWGRQSVRALLAAARWERRHASDEAPPIGALDVETAFLLPTRLVQLPDHVSGSCRLALELPNGAAARLAGIVVELRDGQVVSCTTRLEGRPDARVVGRLPDWFAAMIEGDPAGLETGGDSALARAVVEGVQTALSDFSLRN